MAMWPYLRTDEAQKAETVLSEVSYIYTLNFFFRSTYYDSNELFLRPHYQKDKGFLI